MLSIRISQAIRHCICVLCNVVVIALPAAFRGLECQAACVSNNEEFRVYIRRNDINYPIDIPLNWAIHYRDEGYILTDGCVTDKTNCDGIDYTYAEVPDPGNFSIPHTLPLLFGPEPFTRADVIAYYDNQFKTEDGYDRNGGDLVFTKNCHGHTFDKDHWPQADIYGVSYLVDCYEETSEQYTSVLVHETFAHSFKAHEIGYCDDLETSWYIIQQATEKNNVSPIYTRTGGCFGSPGNLDSSPIFSIPGSYLKLRPKP